MAWGEIVKRLEDLSYEGVAADPARSAVVLREETELFARAVKASGAKAE